MYLFLNPPQASYSKGIQCNLSIVSNTKRFLFPIEMDLFFDEYTN